MPLGAVLAEQAREEIDILGDRQRGIQILPQPLRHVGDPWANGMAMTTVGHVAAQHGYRPGLHLPDTSDQGQHCGFAHRVGADEAHYATGGKLQTDRIHRHGSAVTMADPDQSGDHIGRIGHGGNLTWSVGGHDALGSSRT